MEHDRTYVNLTRCKGQYLSQVTMETDLNVPDQKPDIFQLLHSQGEFLQDEVRKEEGKVKVRGIFLYRILYIGEGNDRMPEILEGSMPVDETIFCEELSDGDSMDFRWEPEHLKASVIHSRKTNVKCILNLKVDVFCEQSVPLLVHLQEEDVYTRNCPVRLQQETVHKKETLRIREDVTLPPGKPNIRRILWKELKLQGSDVRPDEGKLHVKGELLLFVLYESEEEGRRLQWLEQSMPFHYEVDCSSCHRDLYGKTEIRIQRGEMELQADYDGEPRTIRMDVTLDLCMRYFEDETYELLCDVYSLKREIIPVTKTCGWDHVHQINDSRARVSGRVKLPDHAPKVLQILSSGTALHMEHTQKTEQGLLMQGNLELWVLYATSDDAQPLACALQQFPFEHTAESADMDLTSDWNVFLCPDQLMVNMLDEQEFEMKAVLQLQTILWKREQLEMVESLEEKPLDKERMKKMPGMVIHVVQKGEVLWDIAKQYATTCETVMTLNELKDTELKKGQKLLLVKEAGR